VLVLCDPSSANSEAALDERCSHLTGDHQEGPDRVSCILHRLQRTLAIQKSQADAQVPLNIDIVEQVFPVVSRELLEGVHDADYLDWLAAIVEKQELRETRDSSCSTSSKQSSNNSRQQRTPRPGKRLKLASGASAVVPEPDPARPLTPLLLQDLFPEEWKRYVMSTASTHPSTHTPQPSLLDLFAVVTYVYTRGM
jgi:hypothetical protein